MGALIPKTSRNFWQLDVGPVHLWVRSVGSDYCCFKLVRFLTMARGLVSPKSIVIWAGTKKSGLQATTNSKPGLLMRPEHSETKTETREFKTKTETKKLL